MEAPANPHDPHQLLAYLEENPWDAAAILWTLNLDATEKAQGVANFLRRVYDELRNLGVVPQERALNYAATNAFQVTEVFKEALEEGMDLDTIEVERSPLCRPDSECWDVKLTFFNPKKVFEQARKVYRFTVDVSDVVMVGSVRSWFVR